MSNGWPEYQKLILDRLERTDNELSEIHKEIKDIRQTDLVQIKIELTKLKLHAGIAGATAGMFLAGIVSGLINYIL